ncbi:SHQ1 protein [Ditylenchus destructor]|nr:SHQ1 protein [Ditylenchus destructor]
MITPVFKLQQDNEFLIVEIRAPYSNVKDAEIVYEGKTFLFNCKPYFLRLFLPKEVQENDAENDVGNATYDCDSNCFTVKVPKRVKGEHFPNLEMLSELLAPQKRTLDEIHAKPLIEEIVSTTNADENRSPTNATLGETTDELYAEQNLSVDNSKSESVICDEVCRNFGYGFGWKRHGIFSRFPEDIVELIDLKDTENTPISNRVNLCTQHDKLNFNTDHYLADLFEPEEQLSLANDFSLNIEKQLSLNEVDREQLKNLTVRQLNLFGLNSLHHQIAYSVFDVICAFLYDFRINLGDNCVESGWNIRKISPSLSFLVQWPNVREAALGFVRRSLVYPLFRNWDLSMKVLTDALSTFEKGRVAILKCLLEVRRIFNTGGGECQYLFNQLFMDDLCLWIQSVDEKILQDLTYDLEIILKEGIKKEDVDLALDSLELEARLKMLQVQENDRSSIDSDDDPEE